MGSTEVRWAKSGSAWASCRLFALGLSTRVSDQRLLRNTAWPVMSQPGRSRCWMNQVLLHLGVVLPGQQVLVDAAQRAVAARVDLQHPLDLARLGLGLLAVLVLLGLWLSIGRHRRAVLELPTVLKLSALAVLAIGSVRLAVRVLPAAPATPPPAPLASLTLALAALSIGAGLVEAAALGEVPPLAAVAVASVVRLHHRLPGVLHRRRGFGTYLHLRGPAPLTIMLVLHLCSFSRNQLRLSLDRSPLFFGSWTVHVQPLGRLLRNPTNFGRLGSSWCQLARDKHIRRTTTTHTLP